jgi:hypothetical protein
MGISNPSSTVSGLLVYEHVFSLWECKLANQDTTRPWFMHINGLFFRKELTLQVKVKV